MMLVEEESADMVDVYRNMVSEPSVEFLDDEWLQLRTLGHGVLYTIQMCKLV